MADILPFRAIRYTDTAHLSSLIAPPYDVLDEAGKASLMHRNPANIVKIDLPYLPPKTVGPDPVYAEAATVLDQWLADGVLKQDAQPTFYAYSQQFEARGQTFDRRGFIARLRLEEFSTPAKPTHVVPHEKTYASAIEDRLKLTRATQAQLSPIFGLFPDEAGEVNGILYAGLTTPTAEATMDGVHNKLWAVTDAAKLAKITDLMRDRSVYIADGHHRYTMALAYKKEIEAKNGGPLPADHPANFCLFVLVSMHDDGCVILPTHRIVGGLKDFDIDTLRTKLAGKFAVDEIEGDESAIQTLEYGLEASPVPTFGLFDGLTRKMYTLRLTDANVLKPYEPGQSDAWRSLDVAILRRYLLDEIIGPTFAGGDVKLAYTPDAEKVPGMTDGKNFRLALILRPTPLQALIDLGKHGEVMPQKSTYFYPKLATGMVINPLR